MSKLLDRRRAFDHDIAGALDFVEPHDRPDDVANGFDPVALEPFELALAVVGLLGSLAGAVLADIRLELGRLVFLALGLAFEDLGLFGAQPPVLAVVAGVDGDLAEMQLPDSGRRPCRGNTGRG